MNIYNFLKNVFQDLKLEYKNNPAFSAVILILIAVPLALILNSFFIVLLVLITLLNIQKSNFIFQKALVFPILLFVLMLLSLAWTID